MTEPIKNGNGIWRWVSGLLAALILGMAVQAMREPKDTVTQKEMALQLLVMQNKIDALSNQVAALQQSMNQTNYDVAGIAEKVGVTAHPVVAPAK